MLTISVIRNIISPICQQYGVKAAYLFGSYARGEATEKSDVDIRIELGRIKSLFTLGGFYVDIKEALRVEVDVITEIPKGFEEELMRDEVVLYVNE